MAETYIQMLKRHQNEINALPLGFAFSNQQFYDTMLKWGLNPDTDMDKIYRIPDVPGMFIRKEDEELVNSTFKRHAEERKAAFDSDTTGDGFLYDAFLAELENHEYAYTYDPTDAIFALGFSPTEVMNSPRLKHALTKAEKQAIKNADD